MKQQQQQPPLDSASSASSRRKNMDAMDTTTDTTLVDRWLSGMTLQDKIGQMSQIDINMLLENDASNGGKKRLQLDQVKHFIGEMGIGSVLNTISMTDNNNVHYWTALDYRRAMIQINQVAKEHKRPPVIWGLDSVHGANYIHGAVVTPQPINIAATFNRTVAYQAGVLASRDTRAAGINWLFSPLLGIALEPLWSRVYETYGEDMLVVAEMAQYTIAGIQNYTSSSTSTNSISTKPSRAAACAKHFVGYSMPRHGHDRSPSWIPTRHLYQYFVPPWIKVLKNNNNKNDDDDQDVWIPKTVMESYTETNGIPNVANPQALQYMLRQRLEFQGVLVTDYSEIYNLNTWHHIVDSDEQAVLMALSQGTVDMSMIPWKAQDFFTQVVDAVQQKQQYGLGNCNGISEGRIDVSARRVLQLKYDLNMFQDDESYALQESDPVLHLVGTDVDDVLDMVHQSIVLTKNDDSFLPLDNPQQHLQILVTGPTSASLSYQSGGWTGQWQGVPTNNNNNDDGDNDASWFTYGNTVLQAFSAQPGWDVSYTCGTNILGGECNDDQNLRKEKKKMNRNRNVNVMDDVKNWIGLGGEDLPKNSIERAVVAAANMDVVVICVGEEAYTEKPGDITSLELPPGQVALVRAIQESQLAASAAPNANSPPAKIILVYFGGRPRLLSAMVDHATAVFVAFLPGPSAGDALVDLIRGHVNPSGRLPITYPKYNDASGSPYFHAVSDQCTKTDFDNPQPMPHLENIQCDVQWPFGHGLSYTTFAYSNLHVTGSVTTGLDVAVDVENTGNRPGWEVVMIFTFDTFRSVTPEYKRLRSFEKIHLDASGGTSSKMTMHFKISSDELRFVGPLDESHYIMDPNLELIVGVSPNVDCRTKPDSDLCAQPYDSLKASNAKVSYSPACEAACELWSHSGCLVELFHTGDGKKCLEMCGLVNQCTGTANDNNAMPLTGATDGWGWNYVNCLESVVWGMKGSSSASQQCWKMTALCRDIFKTDQMNEFGIGSSSFSSHSSSLSESATTNIVALCFGLVSSVIIFMLMRGSCFQKSRQEQQRRRQDNEEYSAIQFTGTSTGENNDNGDDDERNFT